MIDPTLTGLSVRRLLPLAPADFTPADLAELAVRCRAYFDAVSYRGPKPRVPRREHWARRHQQLRERTAAKCVERLCACGCGLTFTLTAKGLKRRYYGDHRSRRPCGV